MTRGRTRRRPTVAEPGTTRQRCGYYPIARSLLQFDERSMEAAIRASRGSTTRPSRERPGKQVEVPLAARRVASRRKALPVVAPAVGVASMGTAVSLGLETFCTWIVSTPVAPGHRGSRATSSRGRCSQLEGAQWAGRRAADRRRTREGRRHAGAGAAKSCVVEGCRWRTAACSSAVPSPPECRPKPDIVAASSRPTGPSRGRRTRMHHFADVLRLSNRTRTCDAIDTFTEEEGPCLSTGSSCSCSRATC